MNRYESISSNQENETDGNQTPVDISSISKMNIDLKQMTSHLFVARKSKLNFSPEHLNPVKHKHQNKSMEKLNLEDEEKDVKIKRKSINSTRELRPSTNQMTNQKHDNREGQDYEDFYENLKYNLYVNQLDNEQVSIIFKEMKQQDQQASISAAKDDEFEQKTPSTHKIDNQNFLSEQRTGKMPKRSTSEQKTQNQYSTLGKMDLEDINLEESNQNSIADNLAQQIKDVEDTIDIPQDKFNYIKNASLKKEAAQTKDLNITARKEKVMEDQLQTVQDRQMLVDTNAYFHFYKPVHGGVKFFKPSTSQQGVPCSADFVLIPHRTGGQCIPEQEDDSGLDRTFPYQRRRALCSQVGIIMAVYSKVRHQIISSIKMLLEIHAYRKYQMAMYSNLQDQQHFNKWNKLKRLLLKFGFKSMVINHSKTTKAIQKNVKVKIDISKLTVQEQMIANWCQKIIKYDPSNSELFSAQDQTKKARSAQQMRKNLFQHLGAIIDMESIQKYCKSYQKYIPSNFSLDPNFSQSVRFKLFRDRINLKIPNGTNLARQNQFLTNDLYPSSPKTKWNGIIQSVLTFFDAKLYSSPFVVNYYHERVKETQNEKNKVTLYIIYVELAIILLNHKINFVYHDLKLAKQQLNNALENMSDNKIENYEIESQIISLKTLINTKLIQDQNNCIPETWSLRNEMDIDFLKFRKIQQQLESPSILMTFGFAWCMYTIWLMKFDNICFKQMKTNIDQIFSIKQINDEDVKYECAVEFTRFRRLILQMAHMIHYNSEKQVSFIKDQFECLKDRVKEERVYGDIQTETQKMDHNYISYVILQDFQMRNQDYIKSIETIYEYFNQYYSKFNKIHIQSLKLLIKALKFDKQDEDILAKKQWNDIFDSVIRTIESKLLTKVVDLYLQYYQAVFTIKVKKYNKLHNSLLYLDIVISLSTDNYIISKAYFYQAQIQRLFDQNFTAKGIFARSIKYLNECSRSNNKLSQMNKFLTAFNSQIQLTSNPPIPLDMVCHSQNLESFLHNDQNINIDLYQLKDNDQVLDNFQILTHKIEMYIIIWRKINLNRMKQDQLMQVYSLINIKDTLQILDESIIQKRFNVLVAKTRMVKYECTNYSELIEICIYKTLRKFNFLVAYLYIKQVLATRYVKQLAYQFTKVSVMLLKHLNHIYLVEWLDLKTSNTISMKDISKTMDVLNDPKYVQFLIPSFYSLRDMLREEQLNSYPQEYLTKHRFLKMQMQAIISLKLEKSNSSLHRKYKVNTIYHYLNFKTATNLWYEKQDHKQRYDQQQYSASKWQNERPKEDKDISIQNYKNQRKVSKTPKKGWIKTFNRAKYHIDDNFK